MIEETRKELVQSIWEMEDDWISFEEVASCVGISYRTVQKLFWNGEFGKGLMVKVSGREVLRVRRSRVNEYLMHHVVDPSRPDEAMEILPNRDLLFLHKHMDQLDEETAHWCRQEVDRRIEAGLIPPLDAREKKAG